MFCLNMYVLVVWPHFIYPRNIWIDVSWFWLVGTGNSWAANTSQTSAQSVFGSPQSTGFLSSSFQDSQTTVNPFSGIFTFLFSIVFTKIYSFLIYNIIFPNYLNFLINVFLYILVLSRVVCLVIIGLGHQTWSLLIRNLKVFKTTLPIRCFICISMHKSMSCQ